MSTNMISFPLDAEAGNESKNYYSAKDLGVWMSTKSRGVVDSTTDFLISANGGMTVMVGSGRVYLEWTDFWRVMAVAEANTVLTLDIADSYLSRTDSIVVRGDKTNSESSIVVEKGGYDGTIYEPVRNDDFDEVVIGRIFVPSGSIMVTEENITMTTTDKDLCGESTDSTAGGGSGTGLTGDQLNWLVAVAGKVDLSELSTVLEKVLSQQSTHAFWGNGELDRAGDGDVSYIATYQGDQDLYSVVAETQEGKIIRRRAQNGAWISEWGGFVVDAETLKIIARYTVTSQSYNWVLVFAETGEIIDIVPTTVNSSPTNNPYTFDVTKYGLYRLFHTGYSTTANSTNSSWVDIFVDEIKSYSVTLNARTDEFSTIVMYTESTDTMILTTPTGDVTTVATTTAKNGQSVYGVGTYTFENSTRTRKIDVEVDIMRKIFYISFNPTTIINLTAVKGTVIDVDHPSGQKTTVTSYSDTAVYPVVGHSNGDYIVTATNSWGTISRKVNIDETMANITVDFTDVSEIHVYTNLSTSIQVTTPDGSTKNYDIVLGFNTLEISCPLVGDYKIKALGDYGDGEETVYVGGVGDVIELDLTIYANSKLADFSWEEINYFAEEKIARYIFTEGDSFDVDLPEGKMTMRIVHLGGRSGISHQPISGNRVATEILFETRHLGWDTLTADSYDATDSEYAKTVNGYYDFFPEELKKVMKYLYISNVSTLLASWDMYCGTYEGYTVPFPLPRCTSGYIQDEERMFNLYRNGESRVKRTKNGDGDPADWFGSGCLYDGGPYPIKTQSQYYNANGVRQTQACPFTKYCAWIWGI